MTEKKVEAWRIIVSGSDYTPPECRRFHLQAIAPWAEDGKDHLTSSPLVGEDDNGNVLITRSGSRYRLGEPEHSGCRTFAEMRKAHPGVPLS